MKLLGLIIAFTLAGFGSCSVRAQTPITSQNILTPTVNAWSGSVAGQNGGSGPNAGGGNGPAFNVLTNTLIFGYTTKTATQNITAEAFAIQHALDLSNSGIKINGYNYSWKINNSGEQTGTLTGKVEMMRGTSALETYTYNYNSPTNGFEQMTGTQTFANQQSLLAGDSIRLSFTGKDSRFWAGYWGPQVRDPSLTLNYTTDPCLGNPLYSPSCAGYSNVLTSQTIAAQSYAINQALDIAGAGVKINGFEYGYSYLVGGDYCHFGFIVCFDTRPSSMEVNVGVTSSTGTSLYSAKHTHGPNTSGEPSYSYVFPQQRLLSTMGNFTLSTTEVGTTALYSSWSKWKYTPDPCVVNPLSSSTCDGYAVAYKIQQCTISALYDTTCPGYAAALFTQQCTANVLSDTTCPGYAAAYLTQQCTLNPLYSTTCSGYETAYFDQQCSLDATYNSRCPGYAVAYKTKQCTASPLYATDCPGYEQAYLNSQCIRDSLYSRLCEGYNTAYAIKYLTPISTDSTVATAVNGSLSDTAAVKANDPANTKVATNAVSTTVNTDGSISTGVSTTGDTNVDKAITNKTSTTNTTPAAVQLAPPPPGPGPSAQAPQERKPEGKQEGKPEGKEGGGPAPQMAQNGPQGNDSKPAQPTVRQELQAKREANAKAEAIEKGKNLANEMGKVADMESQKQIQNVVIQAMGFTPGFDAYGKTVVPDVVGYKPFTVYNNQKTIDNRANLRMFGGTDRLHNEMVDSQYNKGN
jgi:hypothetical protein